MKKRAVFLQHTDEDAITAFHFPMIYRSQAFRLTLNTSLGILSLYEVRDGELPRMLVEDYFPAGETRFLQPIFQHLQAQAGIYQQYCPHALLYAYWFAEGREVTTEMITWANGRIQDATDGGFLDEEVRFLRNVASRIRGKVSGFGIDILPVLGRGYLLAGTGVVRPAAPGWIRHIPMPGRLHSVLTTHTILGTLSLIEPGQIIQRKLSDGEYRVFMALVDAMPMVCPSEVLLASYHSKTGIVTLDEIDAARATLRHAMEQHGAYTRVLRGVYSAVCDLRKKLDKLGLTIDLQSEVGYKLVMPTSEQSTSVSSSQSAME